MNFIKFMSMDNTNFHFLSEEVPKINRKKGIKLLTKKHKFDKLLCENILNSKIVHEKSNRIVKKKSNKLIEKGKSVFKNTGRWTLHEHAQFIEGILKYGSKWKHVEKLIGTRSAAQSRSHGQKFFIKLAKQNILCFPDSKDDKLCTVSLIKRYSEELKICHKFNEFKQFLIDMLHDTNINIKQNLEINESFQNFLSSHKFDMNLKIISNRSPNISNITLLDKSEGLTSDKRDLFVYIGSNPIENDVKDELNLKLVAVVNSSSNQSKKLPNQICNYKEVSYRTSSRHQTEIKEYTKDNFVESSVSTRTEIKHKKHHRNIEKSKFIEKSSSINIKRPFLITKMPKEEGRNTLLQSSNNLKIDENLFYNNFDIFRSEEAMCIPNTCIIPCDLTDLKVKAPSLQPFSSGLLSSEGKPNSEENNCIITSDRLKVKIDKPDESNSFIFGHMNDLGQIFSDLSQY